MEEEVVEASSMLPWMSDAAGPEFTATLSIYGRARTAIDQEAVFRCLWRPERGLSRLVKSPYSKITSPN
jgi:hypothetical protein